ncbi:MAG: DUF3667 domain-containing protein [Saprospiraceae bacterium]|nr:DUF3667 domain-containing protein [Saprospiraceae bacterium]
MATKVCLNCSAALEKGEKFCAGCGQSTKTKRLSLRQVRKDLLKKFLHADAGIFHLTKEMIFRPGLVAKEYVEGKRKKYYSPLNYLTLSAAVSVFLNEYFHLLERMPGQANPGTEFAMRYFNLIILFSVPVSALFSWWLFRKKGFNYAENLAFHAFLGGFRTVFFVLIFTPLVLLASRYYYTVLMLYLGAWIAYLAWAKIQFFGGPKWLTILKTILILLFNQILVTLVVVIYIYWQRHS